MARRGRRPTDIRPLDSWARGSACGRLIEALASAEAAATLNLGRGRSMDPSDRDGEAAY